MKCIFYVKVTRLQHLKYQRAAKFNLNLKYETGDMKGLCCYSRNFSLILLYVKSIP